MVKDLCCIIEDNITGKVWFGEQFLVLATMTFASINSKSAAYW